MYGAKRDEMRKDTGACAPRNTDNDAEVAIAVGVGPVAIGFDDGAGLCFWYRDSIDI
jgi:hypothetical protein